MSPKTKKSQFLLLFHHTLEGPDPTPEEMQQIFSRWMAWMKGLKANGDFLGSNRLQETGKVLRGPGGKAVTDGPFTEAKEIVGGYILVAADNYAEAMALARGCPGLDGEVAVEVREIEPMPEV
jgi:hypothetical protein